MTKVQTETLEMVVYGLKKYPNGIFGINLGLRTLGASKLNVNQTNISEGCTRI